MRVANELGAGNGRGAKFAVIVSVTTSIIIGLFFWLLIMIFHNELALIFSTSKPVLKEVSKLAILLAFTVLLNSVQPILSGIALFIFLSKFVRFALIFHKMLYVIPSHLRKLKCLKLYLNRSGCRIWMAILCGVHKFGLLLFN